MLGAPCAAALCAAVRQQQMASLASCVSCKSRDVQVCELLIEQRDACIAYAPRCCKGDHARASTRVGHVAEARRSGVQGPVTMEDVRWAKEAFACGGSLPVRAITTWNDRPIGNGEVNTGALALYSMIMTDMKPPVRERAVQASRHWDRVPYGILTGMEADLPGRTRQEVIEAIAGGPIPAFDFI